MQHPELGRRILDRVAEAVDHVGRVEVFPKQDGRNMVMVLVPGQGTRRQREAAAEQREAVVQATAPVAETTEVPAADPAPADTQAETPAETPAETSAETPAETPTETRE